jgi:hypothetical protein
MNELATSWLKREEIHRKNCNRNNAVSAKQNFANQKKYRTIQGLLALPENGPRRNY